MCQQYDAACYEMAAHAGRTALKARTDRGYVDISIPWTFQSPKSTCCIDPESSTLNQIHRISNMAALSAVSSGLTVRLR